MLLLERTGRGEPVVLVHGFLGSARMWASLASRLARSFDVVAVDLPGFGRDHASAAPASIEAFAHAVMQTLDDLEIGRFHLIGHSMGGMVAQQIALECGRRVRRLILYGTAGSGQLTRRFEPISNTIARMRSAGVAAPGRDIVASWFTEGEAAAGFGSCHADIAGVSLQSAVAALTAIERWNLRARLREILAATLVIGGDADRSTPPEELVELFSSLPHADLCILPGCAHAAHLERPEWFESMVGRFLATPDRA